MNSPVTFSHLSFSWPDGTVVAEDVSAVFNKGRTGLVGANGSGKTTLLRLIIGQLHPTTGDITVSGHMAYVPQTITMSAGMTIADLLGVRDKIDALRAIERGSTDVRDFEVLGDDWDIETQADKVLRELEIGGWVSQEDDFGDGDPACGRMTRGNVRMTRGGGLTGADLYRSVASLSGGEAMAIAIAGCRMRRADITLLDEPTNNLDEVLRESVVQMVRTWPGTVIVVSHDVGLLEEMDEIAEISGHGLSIFGGPYSEWCGAREVEQAAALQAEKTAEAQVKSAKKQWTQTMERTTRNLARGKQKAVGEGMGKGMRDKMKGTAEAGAGRARGVADSRVAEAEETLAQASSRVRAEEHIRLDLPDPGVHASKKILELRWGSGDPDGGMTTTQAFTIVGPERVALTGRNGVGKTTLIEQMLGRRSAENISGVQGRLFTDKVGYLPQRLDNLDDDENAVENILKVAPSATQSDVRAKLAGMLLRGDDVFRPVSTLSGGERFRVAMARLLFADPPAQLLVLDEPTNNLDLTSVDHLVEALNSYHGAILVVSHNRQFLTRIGVTIHLELSPGSIACTYE